MSRRPRREERRTKHSEAVDILDTPLPRPNSKPSVEPKTAAQANYISSIKRNRCTFAVGPAGTGKTYLAARMAAEMYLSKEIKRIVITRPAVESGRSIGYLPGEIEEKMAPYMASYGQGFRDGFGAGMLDYLLAKKKIEVVPLNFMQGLSWDEPMITLFDEAENATCAELKMFLTRVGEHARVVIDGDPAQTMLRQDFGLIDAVARMRGDPEVGVVEFTRDDIVRSGFVRRVLDAYDETNLDTLPDFLTRT